MADRPHITLAMIVKNEEKTLPRLLKSVKPFISSAVIHDTGSTDKTLEVLKEELKDIPHTVKSVEWRSFGENRQAVIEEVADPGYILLADADFEYIITDQAFKNLTADGYFIPILDDNLIYSLVMLIKAKVKWKYVGKTHEYITYGGKNIEKLLYDDIHIVHHHDGGSRSDKFERDLGLLLKDYDEDPNNPRTLFYLAQTYECLGKKSEAATYYKKRAELGGWHEEAYVAMLRYARIKDDLAAFFEAYSYHPSRLEALYEAAIRLRTAPNVVIGLLAPRVDEPLPNDVLFIEGYIWDFALKFELALAYSNAGSSELAANLFQELLDYGVPQNYQDFILKMYDPIKS